jgi:hypothetical protein
LVSRAATAAACLTWNSDCGIHEQLLLFIAGKSLQTNPLEEAPVHLVSRRGDPLLVGRRMYLVQRIVSASSDADQLSIGHTNRSMARMSQTPSLILAAPYALARHTAAMPIRTTTA